MTSAGGGNLLGKDISCISKEPEVAGLSVVDERRQDPDPLVVHPEGRIDVGTAPAFGEQVKRHLHAGSTRLVIDLGGISFVDSSGLGAMIVGLKLARRAGGRPRVAHPPPPVKQLPHPTTP